MAELSQEAIDKLVSDAVVTATEGLTKKNTELLDELKKSRRAAAPDPTALDKLESQNQALQQERDSHLSELRKAQKLAQETTEALKAESAAAKGALIAHTLSSKMAEIGVIPQLLPAALSLFERMADVAVVEGKKAVQMEGKPVEEFFKTWLTTEQSKFFIKAPANSGTNAPGSDNNTPAGKPTITRAEFDALSPIDKFTAALKSTII